VKFHELPVGARFRFFRRGLLLTKTGDRTYASEQAGMHQAAAPDSGVLPEDFANPEPPKAANPYGANNKVAFQKGWVWLDGAFTADQLEAVLADLKKRRPGTRKVSEHNCKHLFVGALGQVSRIN
jgi:hypothetical protein